MSPHLEPRDRLPGVSVSSERRVRSRRSRPIGASILPVRDRGEPLYEREVAALDPSLANRVREPHVRVVGARDDEQPGRVAVVVGGGRPLAARGPHWPHRGRGDRARGSRRGPGPAGCATRPAGLSTTSRCSSSYATSSPSSTGTSTRAAGKLDVDLLAARESMALRTRPAVDQHVARSHEAFGERTCPDFGEVRDDSVQPPARVGVRNAKAVRCQRQRSSGRPPRTRGTGDPLRRR